MYIWHKCSVLLERKKIVLLDVFKFLPNFLSLKLMKLYCCDGSAPEQAVEAILEYVIK